jgi:aminoglycoside phosphotransferase family enzyme/predicted kinase
VEHVPGGLPQFVTDLLSKDAYDHAVGDVRLIQTHISYVLLAGAFAYKIKKPLDLGFLDSRTIERRRQMCEEEVRLNRRLCDGVYLGVLPITRRADGTHRLGGAGKPVEYAVQMRRVREDRTMPHLLASGGLHREHLASLAAKIATFHRVADRSDRIAAFGRVPAVRMNWDENFGQTARYVGRTLTSTQLDHVRAYVDCFVGEQNVLIEARADAGHVRDGHGDLRADSVVFAPGGSVCVMDCIEFNEGLRCGDIASDVAFLAMDLEFRGHRREADEFVSRYIEESDNDETLPALLNFYRAYRAFVRGKVDSMQLEEPEIPVAQRSEAAARAVRYFELAEKYALASLPQVLVVTLGFSGTGKSFTARALAGRAGAVLLSTDRIRREQANASGLGPAAYDDAAYTPQRRDLVYAAMMERATRHLSLRRNVVLDATFLTRRHRELARSAAASAGVALLVVEMTADEAVVRERLNARTNNGSASHARWNTHVRQREDFEPLDDVTPACLVRLDTTRPLDLLVDDVLDAIRKLAG